MGRKQQHPPPPTKKKRGGGGGKEEEEVIVGQTETIVLRRSVTSGSARCASSFKGRESLFHCPPCIHNITEAGCGGALRWHSLNNN